MPTLQDTQSISSPDSSCCLPDSTDDLCNQSTCFNVFQTITLERFQVNQLLNNRRLVLLMALTSRKFASLRGHSRCAACSLGLHKHKSAKPYVQLKGLPTANLQSAGNNQDKNQSFLHDL